MIARVWHGMVKIEKANEYLDYLNKTGIPDYRQTRGNMGAYILRQCGSPIQEFGDLKDKIIGVRVATSAEDYIRANIGAKRHYNF